MLEVKSAENELINALATRLPCGHRRRSRPIIGTVGRALAHARQPRRPSLVLDIRRVAVVRLALSPRRAIPEVIARKFERAQKLYVLTWLDFDLIKAGELVAMTALELALTDRYAGAETERRRKLVAGKAENEKSRRVRSGGRNMFPSRIS